MCARDKIGNSQAKKYNLTKTEQAPPSLADYLMPVPDKKKKLFEYLKRLKYYTYRLIYKYIKGETIDITIL